MAGYGYGGPGAGNPRDADYARIDADHRPAAADPAADAAAGAAASTTADAWCGAAGERSSTATRHDGSRTNPVDAGRHAGGPWRLTRHADADGGAATAHHADAGRAARPGAGITAGTAVAVSAAVLREV